MPVFHLDPETVYGHCLTYYCAGVKSADAYAEGVRRVIDGYYFTTPDLSPKEKRFRDLIWDVYADFKDYDLLFRLPKRMSEEGLTRFDSGKTHAGLKRLVNGKNGYVMGEEGSPKKISV